MFGHQLRLAWRSLLCNPLLTLLVIVAIGLGIGAAMTAATVFRGMAANPIPGKEGRLLYVQLDHWPAGSPYAQPGEPARQLTYRDAVALLDAARAHHQAAMFPNEFVISPPDGAGRAFMAHARLTTADFFPMFETPFRFGHGWTDAQDRATARVAVLSHALNERLFRGEDSTGKTLRIGGEPFTVLGVLDRWRPVPRYYDLIGDPFAAPEDVYLPFRFGIERRLRSSLNNDCWPSFAGDYDAFLKSDCVWINFWIEVESPEQAAAYHRFLDDYATAQKQIGRFPQPLNNRLRTVGEWLDNQGVVRDDTRTQMLLSFAFLAVCLINTVSLLLAKFMARSKEISIRRALGASRRQIFVQYLTEAGVVGLCGAGVGILLTWAGAAVMPALDPTLMGVVYLDPAMIAATALAALIAALAAGAFPAWRACRVAPAVFLKAE